jgi:hypothetical protein
MDNLSPTPGAEKDDAAAKKEITTAAKNAKVLFTTVFNSRFRAANGKVY